jgi:pimeloyl-ACP methyl ester carboxylesterase
VTRALILGVCPNRGHQTAIRRSLFGDKTVIVHIKGRTVWTQDLAVGAHVQVDVRVIVRRACTHALELFHAYDDLLDAAVICKMRHNQTGHICLPESEKSGDDSRLGLEMIGVVEHRRQDRQAMQAFLSDGVNIAFIDEGEGDPVLLIHGFASSVRYNWVEPGWVGFLERNGYRIIAFDNRGHGDSEKLYDTQAYGAPLMAKDARRLLDHLDIGRADVMGYSMGARITAFLALSHPDRVRSAIFGGLGINMVRPMAGTGPIAKALEANSLEDVVNPTARTFRAFAEKTGSDLKALAACIRSSREPITREMLSTLKCPVLVAAGTEDVIGGQADELAALIPGAEALPIPGRDHMLAVGDRIYKDGVLTFLRRRP